MRVCPVNINYGLYIIGDMSVTSHIVAGNNNRRTGKGAGISMVQFRDKKADARRRLEMARRCVALARRLGALSVINDDPRLARAVNADGVHLGADDMSVTEARAIVGTRRIIGASCYASLTTARCAVAMGADYVSFGSVFSSTTKPAAQRVSLSRLCNYKKRLSVPVCAIGGIEACNIRSVVATGVDLFAVIKSASDSARLCDMLN